MSNSAPLGDGRAKIRVGLYLQNRGVPDVDLRNPERGNPGIGGTEFNFITLPYYFQKYFPDAAAFTVYANATGLLPGSVTAVNAADVFEASRKATEDGCDVFIYRPTRQDIEQGFLEAINDLQLTTIAWAHNMPMLRHLDRLTKSPRIIRFVCVGRERLDMVRDHPVFEKALCIYNGFDPSAYVPENHIVGNGNTVVYLGSLVPAKGFHRLARVWPNIKKEIPGARLVVIGSSLLYDRGSKLGEWGVAEESYERECLRPYLSTIDGRVDPSVEFKGLMGTEKIPILQNADIGVANPSGETENCPGSAIEFEACGTPVVSAAEWGLLDTVCHGKTGLLGHTDHDLVENIVYLLQNREVRAAYGRNGIEFVRSRFSYQKICGEWRVLFHDVVNGVPNRPERIHQNLFYRDKYLREIMRRAKKTFPQLRHVPPLFATSGKKALARNVFRAMLSSAR